MKNNPDELYNERRVDDILYNTSEELANKIYQRVVTLYGDLDVFGKPERKEIESLVYNELEDFLQEIRELKR